MHAHQSKAQHEAHGAPAPAPASFADHASHGLGGLAGVLGGATPRVLLQTLGHYAEPQAKRDAREAEGKADMKWMNDYERGSIARESMMGQFAALNQGLFGSLEASTPEERQAILMAGIHRAQVLNTSMTAASAVTQINGALNLAGLDGVAAPSDWSRANPGTIEDVNLLVNRRIESQSESAGNARETAHGIAETANAEHTRGEVSALLADGKVDVAMSLLNAAPEAERERVSRELTGAQLSNISENISPERRTELFGLIESTPNPELKLELFQNAQREANNRNFGRRRQGEHGLTGALSSTLRVAKANARLEGNLAGIRGDGKVSSDEVSELFANYNR